MKWRFPGDPSERAKSRIFRDRVRTGLNTVELAPQNAHIRGEDRL
jgi:hypothetical protein